MTPDDEIDQLYGADPAEFTALRRELVAAAKKRGDVIAAKSIAAQRRPTTAAWVVNALVRVDATAGSRLSALAEQLRAAHASMDGARIRELSAAQRALVDELVRTGLAVTEQSRPSAALRDDVVGTLHAAIADPTVAARLGRLATAERWSGFGEFGTVTAVTPVSRSEPGRKVEQSGADIAAAGKRVASTRAAMAAAQETASAATRSLAARAAKHATARRRFEKLLESLGAAEHEMNAANVQLEVAEEVSRAAADQLVAATSQCEDAEAELVRLTAKREAL